jgi:hypothetical protein
VWRRFLGYGATGWLIEVAMTGFCAVLLDGDRSARARTYLWMLPIYGGGGLLLEQVSRRVRAWPRPLRALAHVPFIYGVEYASGRVLRRVLGRCPWDYGCDGARSRLVRADYAPLWFMVALLFELLREGRWPIVGIDPEQAAVQERKGGKAIEASPGGFFEKGRAP